ncbi:FkbM family methyltransferase [Tritonibacter mobilis]|uniref:FkbM family methyltransferase n=1 Tax=Tritonibacter mobilis TaxID=379347 RepID=UPI00398FF5B5
MHDGEREETSPFKRLRHYLHPEILPDYDALLQKVSGQPYTEIWSRVLDIITMGDDLRLSRRWRFSDRRMLPILLEEILCHREYFAPAPNSGTPRILDCGGNFGLAVFYFKRLFPDSKIEVFEPAHHMADILEFNLKRNKFDDVVLHRTAVCAENGKAPFYVSRIEDPASSLYTERSREDSEELIVPTVSLRSLLKTPVTLLKLDIEGAEAEALAHAKDRLRQCETIICETHAMNGRNTLLDVLNVLDEAGFDWAVARSIWDENEDRFCFVRTVSKARSYCVFARRKDTSKTGE